MPILLLAWFFVLAPAVRAMEPPAHLWHFDECEGNILQDSSGSEDLPQNAIWAVGKWQCAINQAAQTQHNIEKIFSTPLLAGDLTLSFYWRNSAFPHEGRNHVYLKKADGAVAAGMRPSIASRTLYFDGGATTTVAAMPNDADWHLITVTYGPDRMVFYLDGAARNIYPGNFAVASPIVSLEMKGENYPVELDELAIWLRALSAEEVANIYNANQPLQPYTSPPAPEKARLINLWHFDEGAGATAADSVGATVLSPIVKWAEGKFGKSIEHSWPSGYLISKDLNQVITSKDLSIDFWWQNSSYPNEGRGSLMLQTSDGANIFGIRPSMYSGGYYFDGGLYPLSNIFSKDNQWHHLALVYDSYNFYLAFYVDGVEKIKIPKVWFKRPITKLVIQGENFPYKIDELAIWQGALSRTEIKDYYDSGQPHSTEPNPVILVPGIMGSYLYSSIDPGVEVWPAVGKTVIDPWDLHLNQLIMDEQGKPSHNSMIVPPQDIIRSVLDKDFFAGLIEELKQNGYEEGKNLFVFPYDWRLDLNWSANGIPYSGFDSLKDKIEKIKLQTGAQKVNIIAHSMGGLVAKDYIKHYGSDSVNKFIDIGTPHLGAPEALKILMYGDDLGFNYLGLGLNLERIKLISQNFPSVYQLLPSRKYFDSVDQDYAYYFYDMHDLDGNGVTGRLNYAQSIDFMKNTGRNNNLLGFNDVLHSDLDNYSPQSAGVKTYNIMGCGQPTIGQIFILNKEKSGKYEYGLKYITGDGTVPLRSAQAIVADEDYYIRNTEHSTLPSAQGIKQLAKAILDETTADFPLLEYPAMSRNSAECSLTGTQISFHSPIELHVYDENNNHVGPNENGDIELGIAGAQYDDLDGNKFVFLPVGHDYRVVGQATDSEMFNARVQTVQDGQYVETVYYNQVPLDSVSTTVRMQINNGQQAGAMEIYEIDQSGNQILKTLVQPSSVLNQAEAADLAKPETQIEISGTGGTVESGGYYTSATTVALIATDIQGGSGILKTEYSLDNGLTWQNYNNNPIILNDSGEYRILYKATDKAGNIEEIKERKIKLDLIRPETQSNVSGSLGDNSFYISAASVTLTAVDQGGSGILKTEYSLDNGQAWQIYNGPVTLNIDGGFDLFYKSIDRAGNIEEVKEQKLKIDKISPVINILIPLETQEFTRDEFLTPEYEISDNYSGVDSNSLTLLIDNQQGKQDLFYCNLGEHVLKITVSDLAGNQAQASVKFTVSADLDSTIIDVNRSYSLGWISNKTVKGWLNEKLNEIKKYEAKFGERQKKLEQKRGKIMAQCLKKKNQAWCEKKLGKYYDKAVYKLNQIHQKIIAKRYQEILKKLEGYYKKQWLNQSAYGIIKADINYLISNL